jgi:hypothetical protein
MALDFLEEMSRGRFSSTPVVPAPAPTPPLPEINDVFANALRDIFGSAVADDTVYTPLGGAGIACRVLIERNVLLQPSGMDAQVVEQGTTIEAILADVGAEPNRGDTFAIGTETFTVQSIAENDGMTVKIIVT